MSAVVLFVLFFVILLFGLPISVTMGISSILPWVVDNTFAANLVMVLRQMMSGVNSLTLLAIPMFMLSGTIMARGGISKKLFDVFTYFVGNVIGGVPCAVIITCLFYGAISGSAPATVAAVGAMTIPVMVNLGYSKEFSTAVVTVAGGLGCIIPPSIPFVLYSTSAGTSGTWPSKYFFVMLNTRLQRLPHVFARSALYTCTMRSMEMEPSWPNCTSLMK